jgi:hypothetical protein
MGTKLMTVDLCDDLKQLRVRLTCLPQEDPMVQQHLLGVDFAIEQYPSQSPAFRARYSHGLHVFVSELERRHGVSAGYATEQKRRKGSSLGGKNRETPEWHDECIARARTLIAAGTGKREVVGKLFERFGKNESTIRRVLKKAGIK